jgi:anti-sigma factor RsiW
MLQQKKCLSTAEMKARLSVDTSAEESEEVARHIEECDLCADSLDMILAGDTLVTALAGATPLPPATELAERLKLLCAVPLDQSAQMQTAVVTHANSDDSCSLEAQSL